MVLSGLGPDWNRGRLDGGSGMLGRVTDSGVTGSGVRWVRVEWFSGGTGFHWYGRETDGPSGLDSETGLGTGTGERRVYRACRYEVRMVVPYEADGPTQMVRMKDGMEGVFEELPELAVGDRVRSGKVVGSAMLSTCLMDVQAVYVILFMFVKQ